MSRRARKPTAPPVGPVDDALMVDVTVQACDDKGKCRAVKAEGKLDTGAQNTYLPKRLIKQLRPPTIGRARIRGVSGESTTTVYRGVTIGFPGRRLRPVPLAKTGVMVYPTNADHVLLSRKAMAGGDDKRAAMVLGYDAGSGSFSLKQARGRAERGKRGADHEDATESRKTRRFVVQIAPPGLGTGRITVNASSAEEARRMALSRWGGHVSKVERATAPARRAPPPEPYTSWQDFDRQAYDDAERKAHVSRPKGAQRSGDGIYYAAGGRIRIVDARRWPSGVDSKGERWQAFDLEKPISAAAKRNSGQADREQFITASPNLRTAIQHAVHATGTDHEDGDERTPRAARARVERVRKRSDRERVRALGPAAVARRARIDLLIDTGTLSPAERQELNHLLQGEAAEGLYDPMASGRPRLAKAPTRKSRGGSPLAKRFDKHRQVVRALTVTTGAIGVVKLNRKYPGGVNLGIARVSAGAAGTVAVFGGAMLAKKLGYPRIASGLVDLGVGGVIGSVVDSAASGAPLIGVRT